MGIYMMFRKCKKCGHRYTYNPSTGDFGKICPRCHKVQLTIEETESARKFVTATKCRRFLTTVPAMVWWLADMVEAHQKKKYKKNK